MLRVFLAPLGVHVGKDHRAMCTLHLPASPTEVAGNARVPRRPARKHAYAVARLKGGLARRLAREALRARIQVEQPCGHRSHGLARQPGFDRFLPTRGLSCGRGMRGLSAQARVELAFGQEASHFELTLERMQPAHVIAAKIRFLVEPLDRIASPVEVRAEDPSHSHHEAEGPGFPGLVKHGLVGFAIDRPEEPFVPAHVVKGSLHRVPSYQTQAD